MMSPPLKQWQVIPPSSPAAITTETLLLTALTTTPFLTPVLYGGVGDVLFQIAGVSVAAKARGDACIIAWWDEDTATGAYAPFDGPLPNITLKNVFPNINYATFYPSHRGVAHLSLKDSKPSANTPLPAYLPSPYIDMRLYDPIYYHADRAYVLNTVLQFHPSMVDYISSKYNTYLHKGIRQTVSVHFHLNSNTALDTSPNDVTTQWYEYAMFTEFDPTQTMYMLFADDAALLTPFLDQISISHRFTYHIVQEDYANALLLMSLCRHHIGSASSYSYWGAYLDMQQPTGGRTIFPQEFLDTYGFTLPFSEWEVLTVA